jgi:hypothetical protein
MSILFQDQFEVKDVSKKFDKGAHTITPRFFPAPASTSVSPLRPAFLPEEPTHARALPAAI